MDKKDDNERSTTSKVIFGTWLTNGLVISVFGFIILLVGLSGDWHVGNIEPGTLIIVGAIVLVAGVSCIGIHLATKKDK